MTTKNLQSDEYNPFYQTYIDRADQLTLKEGLKHNSENVIAFFEHIPENKHEYSYQEGKWTIKEMLQHIIDTERIFTYRALCVAREDKTSFPGFDENAYVPPSMANNRTFESLMNEYKVVRSATITLFESFTEEMLLQVGIASNSPISVRALGFIIMGHENHHCGVLRERYL